MLDNRREPILSTLERRGITRRQFLKFCGAMAAVLALPATEIPVIAEALEATPRLPIVWLEFQDCTGDTESFLRAGHRADPLVPGTTDPSITELLLQVLSVDYHETLMAPAGTQAERSRQDAIVNHAGQYLCVVEGSVPAGAGGIYCTIGGRTALSIVQEVTGNARATIALGSCAWDGGLAASGSNPTGATGVSSAVPGLANLIALPGCPANVVNLVATIVYFLTYDQLPPLDGQGRANFAYRRKIHSQCERHDHYEHDRYVRAWGDHGHRMGWCLKEMGCRGPETRHNCPTVRWNGEANWPVGAGHGCIGCSEAHFWDRLSPIYQEYDDDEHDEEDDEHDEEDD